MIVVMAVMMVLALMAGSGMMGMHGGHEKPVKQEAVEKQTEGNSPDNRGGEHHQEMNGR